MVRPVERGSELQELVGGLIDSPGERNVTYQLAHQLGVGGMAAAFLSLRMAPDGQTPCVVKILLPDFVLQAGQAAALAVHKEATCLSMLNQRTPPTAHVVRLIAQGSTRVAYPGLDVVLPWIAMEYVHGGVEGGTLFDRVQFGIRSTGQAFDLARAAHAVESIARGLDAVHEVGIIHRDITPNNVLCCGFGKDEVFKIADFGVARPSSIAATFGGVLVGTPGYAPPEQASLDPRLTGPWSDVFGFACVVFYLLTGRHYFEVDSPMDALEALRRPRFSLRRCPYLAAELEERESVCRALDQAIEQATSLRPEERPRSAQLFAATVLPWLRPESRRVIVAADRLKSVMTDDPTLASEWQWTVRYQPGGDFVVRNVAWDADGRCLAATSDGLAFWNGTAWLPAPTRRLHDAGLRFVHRTSVGRWLIGGDGSILATFSVDGVGDVVQGPDARRSFVFANGDLEDLAVFVSTKAGESPLLYGYCSRRWTKPILLEGVAHVSAVAQTADDQWMVVGRRESGRAFAGLFRPLMFEIPPVDVPDESALLACAGLPELHVGVAGGTGGLVVWLQGGTVEASRLDGGPHVSATAVDVGGRGWAAGSGSIWLRQSSDSGGWSRVWSNSEWASPFVSLFADHGIVIALSADGGIVDGRSMAYPLR